MGSDMAMKFKGADKASEIEREEPDYGNLGG
jgi:hypothetical protein